jgi:hypothetical protein
MDIDETDSKLQLLQLPAAVHEIIADGFGFFAVRAMLQRVHAAFGFARWRPDATGLPRLPFLNHFRLPFTFRFRPLSHKSHILNSSFRDFFEICRVSFIFKNPDS